MYPQEWFQSTNKSTLLYTPYIQRVMKIDMSNVPVERLNEALTTMESKEHAATIYGCWQKELEHVLEVTSYVYSQVHPFSRKRAYTSSSQLAKLEWIQGEMDEVVVFMHRKVKLLVEVMKQLALGADLVNEELFMALSKW
jgi:hypothetical protein